MILLFGAWHTSGAAPCCSPGFITALSNNPSFAAPGLQPQLHFLLLQIILQEGIFILFFLSLNYFLYQISRAGIIGARRQHLLTQLCATLYALRPHGVYLFTCAVFFLWCVFLSNQGLITMTTALPVWIQKGKSFEKKMLNYSRKTETWKERLICDYSWEGE